MGVRISPPVQRNGSAFAVGQQKIKKGLKPNQMEKLKAYILESVDEIRNKVSWPKFSELQSSAILVLVASIIFALIIWVFDLGFNGALAWFYKEF
jgi:preprotein translocase subunit SecE